MKFTSEEKGLPRPPQSEKLTQSAMSTGTTRNTPSSRMTGAVNNHPEAASPRRIPVRRDRLAVADMTGPSSRVTVSRGTGPPERLLEQRFEVLLRGVEDRLRVARRQRFELAVEVGDDVGGALRRRDTLGVVGGVQERHELRVVGLPLVGGGLDRRHRAERLGEGELVALARQLLDQLQRGG